MKPSRNIIISLKAGIVTAIVLGMATPLMMLGELGGPIDFAIPVLFIAFLGLTVAAFISKPRNFVIGGVCGLAFSLPIAAACYLICHSEPRVLGEHGRQMRFAGLVIAAISVVVLAGVGVVRSPGPRKDEEVPPTNPSPQ